MSEDPQQDMNIRVNRLEWRVEHHDEQLGQLHQDYKRMDKRLESIDKRLFAIFWAIVGAGFMIVSSELGLVHALKAML